MVYAKIVDGKVTETGPCPINTDITSNFRLLSNEDKKKQGWYKVIENPISKKPWEIIESTDYIYDSISDNVTLKETISDIPIEDFKKTKIEQIKQTLNQITNEGFTCSNNIKLDCRESDKTNWISVRILALENPTGVQTIRDFNNDVHFDLSNTEIKQMMGELLNHYNVLYSNKWVLEQEINACEFHKDIDAIYWRKPIYTLDGMTITGYDYNPILGGE